ncbi:MAG: hypothetical protein P8X42_04920 [Calditrichaceae bacterium]
MTKNNKQQLVFFIIGAAICIILGLIFFGQNIFNTRSLLFGIITGGITGAAAFALFNAKRNRDAVFISILLFIITYFISGKGYFITQLLYLAGIVVSVFVYSKWTFGKLKSAKYARPLILAGFISVAFIAAYLLLVLIYYSDTIILRPFTNMPIGFLIGLGLGIGFEIAEILKI